MIQTNHAAGRLNQDGDLTMVQITVTDEIARAISDAGSDAILVDTQGRFIGQITPAAAGPIGMTAEHMEELQRRMANDDGVRYTWAEVREYLHTLAPE